MSKPDDANRYLTLKEAAVVLRFTGAWAWRKTRRLLEKCEKADGRRYLFRFGGAGNGSRWRTTLRAMRRALPQFFWTGDELPPILEERFAALENADAEAAKRDGALGARIRELSGRITKAEGRRA